MDTRTDTTPQNNTSSTLQAAPSPPGEQKKLPGTSALDWIIILGLAIVALIPRIILANQLDLVTDESIYIIAGKTYFPLLTHLHIHAAGWSYNYEHPPFAKLLFGLAIYLDAHAGHLFGELLAARVPSIIMGTLLIVAIYWLGRASFGRVVALLAALCLAVSPWLVYFSALAYLDMTMTALITIAYLLLWPAIRQPRLYLLAAALVGLGAASKYTAVLVIPGMVLFTAYYFLLLRSRLPIEQRPPVPWRWWVAAGVQAPVVFFLADPAIWPHPIGNLIHSFRFEWQHSVEGHLTFLAGQYSGHVPHWAILYIILAKMSASVTIPAACFAIFALIQLVRFHLNKTTMEVTEASSMAFLLLWLLSILGAFSLLNIVVGTHYHLPLAVPVAFAGAFAWVMLFRYRRGALFQTATTTVGIATTQATTIGTSGRPRINLRAAIILALLTLFLVGPHLVGLTTVYGAEGYTSEFFTSENNALQVAYPAYREAAAWLLAHTSGSRRVGMAAVLDTLDPGLANVSWFNYNRNIQGRLKFIEAHVYDHTFSYDYLVWPMHLVQRGFPIPGQWLSRIVHTIIGGNTIYCYILAWDAATISH